MHVPKRSKWVSPRFLSLHFLKTILSADVRVLWLTPPSDSEPAFLVRAMLRKEEGERVPPLIQMPHVFSLVSSVVQPEA